MAKPETRAYLRLKECVTRPTDRFERVENGLVDGMPDVSYCMVGVEGWIELKAPQEPARPATPLFSSLNHPVLLNQINWFRKQVLARGLAWLFIATDKRVMLIKGSTVATLGATINELTAAELERRAVWRSSKPVQPEGWMNLRELLCTPDE